MSALDTKSQHNYQSYPSKYTLLTFLGKTKEIIVTDKASKANEWVHQVLSKYARTSIVVGLEMEFTSKQNHYNSTALHKCRS